MIKQFNVLRTIFYYVAFILLAPITTFFIVKCFIFEAMLNTTEVTKNVWSAVAAVIMLHIALGLYIHKAYSTADREKDARNKED